MRLTKWTDYTMRVLMYCASMRHRPEPVTIQEIAKLHDISRSHLMKIVMTLSALGWVESVRGRGGGIRLLIDPHQLRVGDVLRQTETDFDLVECFDPQHNNCKITHRCQFRKVLQQAMSSYLRMLDQVSLADLVPEQNGHGIPIQLHFESTRQ
jgi:Rrf2 family nitric oxide-sensitive transcriptional repressor